MKLIFHIGAGKTGSSSIQKSLRKNDLKLKEQGVWYLGMMLGSTAVQKYSWQQQASSIVVEDFHKLSEDEATNQILDVLQPIIALAKEKHYHTLIWSNESFFGRKYNFTNALKALQDQNINIEILIYVRNYVSWAQSAYIQWGLKHKTYEGKIQSFSEWIKNKIPFFHHDIHRLDVKLPNVIKVRNMSACQDVVLDFYHYIGLEENTLDAFRDNDSPNNTELFLRSLFNSKFNAKVLIKRYDNLFGNNISYDITPENFLQNILPTENDFLKINKIIQEDQFRMNKLLLKQGQPILIEKSTNPRSSQVNTNELIMALSDIIMKQAKRIDIIETKLKEITSE